MSISFKERVKNIAISEATSYKQNFIDYQYLICSDAFKIKNYYIIDSKPDNYQHLLGIHSLINAQEFFDKCYNGTLQEADFDFIKKGQDEKSVKGSVRRKITALPSMVNIFQKEIILAEESFIKNQIICTFATGNNECTLGFIDVSTSRPKSLLRGNELNMANAKNVRLLLRKHKDKEKFNEMIIGDLQILMKYYDFIDSYIDDSLDEKIEIKSQLSEIG